MPTRWPFLDLWPPNFSTHSGQPEDPQRHLQDAQRSLCVDPRPVRICCRWQYQRQLLSQSNIRIVEELGRSSLPSSGIKWNNNYWLKKIKQLLSMSMITVRQNYPKNLIKTSQNTHLLKKLICNLQCMSRRSDILNVTQLFVSNILRVELEMPPIFFNS